MSLAEAVKSHSMGLGESRVRPDFILCLGVFLYNFTHSSPRKTLNKCRVSASQTGDAVFNNPRGLKMQ
jgi:hypothetical protein